MAFPRSSLRIMTRRIISEPRCAISVMLCPPRWMREGMFLSPTFQSLYECRAEVIITHAPSTSDACTTRREVYCQSSPSALLTLAFSTGRERLNELFPRRCFSAFGLFSATRFHNLGVGWVCTLLGCLTALFILYPYVLYKKGRQIRMASK